MKRKPVISDRVESVRTSCTTYNGSPWVPGMCGELTAYPSAVRLVRCSLCGVRHQTFALVEFWTYAMEEGSDVLESPLRKVHDRVALPVCDIQQV